MKWEAMIIIVPEGWNCGWGSNALSAVGDYNKRQKLPKTVSNLNTCPKSVSVRMTKYSDPWFIIQYFYHNMVV